MLTDTELEKLKKSNPRDKANDYIVRKKIKNWLDGSYYISVIILHYLPERQIKRIIKHEHILHLCNSLLHILSMMSVPIVKRGKHEYIAVVPNYPPRAATKEEVAMMEVYIKPLIRDLFSKLSSDEAMNVIRTEIAELNKRNPSNPRYLLTKEISDEYPENS